MGIKPLSQKGFTLIEAVVVAAIAVLVISVSVAISIALNKSTNEVTGIADATSYRTELKRKLRSFRTNTSSIKNLSECSALLGAGGPKALSGDSLRLILDNMVKDPSAGLALNTEKKRFQVEIPDANLLAPSGQNTEKFGNQFVTNTRLNSFVLFSENNGFRIPNPQVINMLNPLKPVSTFITYIVQAELHAELSKLSADPNGPQRVPMRPIRMNMAIQRSVDGTTTLLECGSRHLAETVAQFEFCKSLGPDFKFVYDNFDNKGSGQCYAPMYDPTRQSTSFSDADFANGRTAMITDYIPLKGFFCRFAMAGRGYDFSFCTGLN